MVFLSDSKYLLNMGLRVLACIRPIIIYVAMFSPV